MIADDNPITAITRDHVRSRRFPGGDTLPPDFFPVLNEAKRQLLEARRQFLEAKRRYFMLCELARLYRIRAMRRQQQLEELARQGSAGVDAARSSLNPEPDKNILRLQKLKQLIRIREIRLRRQEHTHRLRDKAEGAQRRRQDPELQDNLRKLRKLKNLVQLHQVRLRQQKPGFSAFQRVSGSVHVVNARMQEEHTSALWKRMGDLQPKLTPIEEPKEPRNGHKRRQCRGRDAGVALPRLTAESCRQSLGSQSHARKTRCGLHLRNAYRRSSCINRARQRQANLEGTRQGHQFQRCCKPAGLVAQKLMVRGPPLSDRLRRLGGVRAAS
jgi:hypothetical protein